MNIHLAQEICKQVEPYAQQNGYHVALTGGSLYYDGPRKDLDLYFYPHNFADGKHYLTRDKLLKDLESLGFVRRMPSNDAYRDAYPDTGTRIVERYMLLSHRVDFLFDHK